MKKIALFFSALLAAVVCSAQLRTGSDIDSKTFVIGLDNYIVGEAGGLGFSIKNNAFKVEVLEETVSVAKGSQKVVLYKDGLKVPAAYDYSMPVLKGDFVVGVHDFTDDTLPELVIAVRDDAGNGIIAFILQYKDNKWISIGEIGAVKGNVNEIRVFRQTLTIKNQKTGALYTWTYKKNGFVFKASDKTASAANLL
ncbi:MAG: hypothetical protein IKX37_03020 [Bacteroidales bacterium]|jgi:hypothetical protein|nr:hypothetical protein [Bacteroidales bacterium]